MFMKKLLVFISLLVVVSAAFASAADRAAYYNDRILICLQPDLSIDQISYRQGTPVTGIPALDQLLELREITVMEKFLPAATADDMDGDIVLANIYRLRSRNDKLAVQQLIQDFSKVASILYAEQETIDRVLYTPNDSRYNQQWFLPRIQAPAAWDLWDIAGGETPGDLGIVLASVDSGVQYTHPDLWQHAWINQAEVPESIFNSVDTDNDGVITATEVVAYCDDYNSDGSVNLQDALHSSSPFMDGVDGDDWDNNPSSYVDDLLGYDVSGVTSATDPDNDPMGAFNGSSILDVRMHGTHVAGLLAATTDNTTGIASTIYNGSLMSVKCLYDQDSDGYISGGYSGMLYAAKAGANIMNLSWGGIGYSASSQATVNLIYNTYGVLIVAAAGNGDDSGNPSDVPHYPSGYDHVVSVTAVGPSDNFSWANYGSGEGNNQFFGVDLSAPGENIHSTVFTNHGSYASWPGTSMASPIVASSFGLLKSANPAESNDWLIDNMLSTTDNIDDINPNYIGQLGTGRLNVYNALAHTIFPRLSYDSYSLQMVNDNGDGQLSPGEEAKMRVNLYNETGWVDAGDVTGILHSSSEFVSITDSTGDYGDINNGNIGVNIMDRYQFSIAADAPSGQYPFTLELSANPSSDHPYMITLDFSVEASMWQANFPVATGIVKSGNAVVDLDGDGTNEIIFGADDSLLHALEADGTELAGFPVFLNKRLEATPAVGDIDNDGDLEIVIGGLDYNLYVVQHDGTFASIYTSTRYIMAPSTLYDLDGDGDLEIITPTYADVLAVLHHDGTPFGNFPLTLDDNMTGGAAVADLNGDGSPNIIIGTWGDQLHALNLDGSEVDGFPVMLSDRMRSGVVVANIDNSADGSLEILVGGDDNNMHAYDAGGNELWSFSTLGQNIQADPAVCDMDGDGDLEIIFGGLDRNIYALDHTGTILPGWPVVTGGVIYSAPALADIDGDGLAEIFIGSNDHKLYGLHLDGSSIGGFPTESSGKIQGNPSIADLDGDGDLEVVVGTDDNLAVLDLGTGGETGSYWPTHRGNLQRTGTLPGLVPVTSEHQRPDRVQLAANYPNPFNPSTSIGFTLPETAVVSLEVLDIRGRVVATLLSGKLTSANYLVNWDGSIQGNSAPAGIYLYRLTTPEGSLVKKMTLLK